VLAFLTAGVFGQNTVNRTMRNGNDFYITSMPSVLAGEIVPNGKPAAAFLNGKLIANLNDVNPADVESFGVLGANDTVVINSVLYHGIIYVTTKGKPANASAQEMKVEDTKTSEHTSAQMEKDNHYYIRCTPSLIPAAVFLNGKLHANLNDVNHADIESFGILCAKDTLLINSVLYKGIVYVKTKEKHEHASAQQPDNVEIKKSVSEILAERIAEKLKNTP